MEPNSNDRGRSPFTVLAQRLEPRLVEGVDADWSRTDFETLAFEAFRLQWGHCAPYRALCERRGVSPATIDGWEDIPSVPATAFKHVDLSSVPGPPEAVFRTSGTTRGADLRGRHRVPRLALYRASLLDPFRVALLPDMDAIPFLSLIPRPDHVPDSSLSYMIGAAAERFASETHWLVGSDGSWRSDIIDRTCAALRERGDPVLVVSTSLALAHVLDDSTGLLADLPDGSRIMETGGFKGVSGRGPSRAELRRRIVSRTGVPDERIVSEYGMTELLSQLYEPVVREGDRASGIHAPPPWLRVRALDPMSLRPVPEGEEGVLAFFDLANLGSVCHVLTEDVGAVEGGRVRLAGRAVGAEPRGCSRAMDELMAAVAHGGSPDG